MATPVMIVKVLYFCACSASHVGVVVGSLKKIANVQKSGVTHPGRRIQPKHRVEGSMLLLVLGSIHVSWFTATVINLVLDLDLAHLCFMQNKGLDTWVYFDDVEGLK